mgnify:CR=1 FL=1
MKQYALGHAFNLDHIFMNFDLSKLKMSNDLCEEITGDRHRDVLVKRIFRSCVYLILNDIIDNNNTFQLPTGARKADIHMRRIHGDEFKWARKNGKFKEIDFINSNFSGNELTLTMYNREGKPSREKPIYVDKCLKKKIIDNTNNGKQYC